MEYQNEAKSESSAPESSIRVVPAVHGRRSLEPDPAFEAELSRHLKESYSPSALIEHCSRFANGDGEIDKLMRRAIWRAVARKFGNRVRIGSGVEFNIWRRSRSGKGFSSALRLIYRDALTG